MYVSRICIGIISLHLYTLRFTWCLRYRFGNACYIKECNVWSMERKLQAKVSLHKHAFNHFYDQNRIIIGICIRMWYDIIHHDRSITENGIPSYFQFLLPDSYLQRTPFSVLDTWQRAIDSIWISCDMFSTFNYKINLKINVSLIVRWTNIASCSMSL